MKCSTDGLRVVIFLTFPSFHGYHLSGLTINQIWHGIGKYQRNLWYAERYVQMTLGNNYTSLYEYYSVKWGCLISLCSHFLSLHFSGWAWEIITPPVKYHKILYWPHPTSIHLRHRVTVRLVDPVTWRYLLLFFIRILGIIKQTLIMYGHSSCILMSGARNRNPSQMDIPMNPRYYLYYPQSTVLLTGSPHTTTIFTRLTHAH